MPRRAGPPAIGLERTPKPDEMVIPRIPGFRARGGKQKKTPKDPSEPLICLKKIGAGEGIRTLDPDLGKVVLYP